MGKPMAKDYYQILGVPKSASDEEIRKAFKKLARKYHPDVNPGDKKAEDKFKEFSEAYDTLSNPEKRKKYDAFGNVYFEGFPGGGRSYTYTSTSDPFGGVNDSTQFDLGDLFGDFFGGGVRKKPRDGFSYPSSANKPRQGRDLSVSLDLDLLESIQGCEKQIRLNNGVTFKVKIPPGVAEGSRIRLAGKGEPGYHGGDGGDVYIEPKIRPHPYFKRDGNDLLVEVPITVSEALNGAKIKVPTVDGFVQLIIPPKSQSGQKLRLKGKGIENVKTKLKGDQYVVLQIKIPDALDEATHQELTQILKGREPDPRVEMMEEFKKFR